MQVLLSYEKESDTRARVFQQNWNLSDLPQDIINNGILVDTIPTPDTPVGKQEQLYINPQTKELWYEYVDIPKTLEGTVADLQSQNAQMLLALVNGGLM